MDASATEATWKRVSGVFGTDHRRDAAPNARVGRGSPPRVTRTVPEHCPASAVLNTASSRAAGPRPSAPSVLAIESPAQKKSALQQ
ncbi:hypothetical protein AMK24_19810 [Streptomyces sp. CB02366]|nr:hypothetical protein AMK24_19810 [Streptomyces sp. CB02366]TVP33950.1 hypothetical protein A3L22_15280 [Streptomyces griseus subsp. griseus]